MPRFLFFIALVLSLAACSGGSGDEKKQQPAVNDTTPVITQEPGSAPATAATAPGTGGITANQQDGLNEVIHFYGGKCTWSAGDAKDGKKYFRIQISNSASLDSNLQITELSAANIAILFYKDLLAERVLFSEIRTVIVFNDGRKIVKSYPTDKLEIVLSKMMVVMRMAQLLKDKKFNDLAALLNDKNNIEHYNKAELMKKIEYAEQSLGTVKEFIPYGFVFLKSKNNRSVLHISGVLLREGQNNEFSVDFDAASTKDEAVFLNYKL